MMLAAVDFNALLDVIWVSLVAGVGVTVLYSLVILGATRSALARREGRGAEATAYAALMVLSLAAFAAAVAFGVSAMLEK
jgi:hypothetical protein